MKAVLTLLAYSSIVALGFFFGRRGGKKEEEIASDSQDDMDRSLRILAESLRQVDEDEVADMVLELVGLPPRESLPILEAINKHMKKENESLKLENDILKAFRETRNGNHTIN